MPTYCCQLLCVASFYSSLKQPYTKLCHRQTYYRNNLAGSFVISIANILPHKKYARSFAPRIVQLNYAYNICTSRGYHCAISVRENTSDQTQSCPTELDKQRGGGNNGGPTENTPSNPTKRRGRGLHFFNIFFIFYFFYFLFIFFSSPTYATASY